ncbi:hypothetical protein KFL_000070590 [Klebsormidium nitens]|uniref:MYND-type domain-containing protein n=1 Tax=Klebsormidium nitens TaxID=105231 RepID=A0A1Y1HM70_KLENI|nr:hypothetical protein KFL_000070590 [Klebsormidium nitens]|eukprot:GAQ78091.1 hypothetical protein KFL_000070590 [Klebsormidium nitens]
MPSVPNESLAGGPQRTTEWESLLPESQRGSAPILLTFDEFVTIFQKALDTVGAREVQFSPSRTSVTFRTDTPEDRYAVHMDANIASLYGKRKFLNAENCLAACIRCLQSSMRYSQPAEPRESPPENLFLTVKTHEFILLRNEEFQRPSRPRAGLDRVMFRPFSRNSGELYTGLVVGLENEGSYSDIWVPSRQLDTWNVTEDEAFDLALKNIDVITPEKLNYFRIGSLEDLKTSEEARRKDFIFIEHMHFHSQFSNGTLSVVCRDSRALPRLLLPRVVEQLANILNCNPVSLVIVPFEDENFVVGNAEDRISMLLLAVHQTLPFCQGDNPHVQHKVSWNPFRFTKLRNEKGLVELEPYLVNGGRFAVKLWVGDKQTVFYPMPRTKDDIAAVEDLVWRPYKAKFTVLSESTFLNGHCWQCRKRFDKLETCANCRKAKYCSRNCQKRAWGAGHNVNCEERRRFWKAAKMCRPPKTSKKP